MDVAAAVPINPWSLAGRVAGMLAVIAAVLFASAGTVAWPAAWVFLALFGGFTAVLTGWLGAGGAAPLLGGLLLFFRMFQANTYLSPAVRVQHDRGHAVASTGPYRRVRHPMYAAATAFLVGTTLLLGSWYGLVPALLLAVGIAARAVGEERVLRASLPGYADYAATVRYRLVPGVW